MNARWTPFFATLSGGIAVIFSDVIKAWMGAHNAATFTIVFAIAIVNALTHSPLTKTDTKGSKF